MYGAGHLSWRSYNNYFFKNLGFYEVHTGPIDIKLKSDNVGLVLITP